FELSPPAGAMYDNSPRHRRASVRAVVAAIVRPIVAAVPVGRIAIAVTIGRIAVTIGAVAVTVTVGGVSVTRAVIARIVIGIGRPPQRRADQRADGEGAQSPAPAPPTPTGLRRFRRANGDCAGEQHDNQRSPHGFTSLFFVWYSRSVAP